ncbi:MAG: hypothetical protein ABSG96_25360 [Terracidiphilus sp.]|jgi:hypothetical protein
MHATIPLQPKFPANQLVEELRVPLVRARFAPLSIALLAILPLIAVPPLTGQATAEATTPAAGQKAVHPHARPRAGHPAITPAPAPLLPIIPPEPPPPDWPANDRPAQASVVWDSQGLRIEAKNSSLQQILKDVSAATGAKVDGLGSDERIFGVYGPGQARDVLSELLQGSSYNVMMIGDQGQGTPRQILLSTRRAGSSMPAATNSQPNNDDDNDAEEPAPPQPQAPAPAAVRPGFTPGVPPRTPQQIMQEMQQRQQQLQDQHPTPQN